MLCAGHLPNFLLGFIGPKSEALAIKGTIGEFLQTQLNLTMSADKTLITHARTKHAHFLGYAISTYHANDKLTQDPKRGFKRRSANGRIRLGLPYGRVDELARQYQQDGRSWPDHRLLECSDAHIIDTYQQRYRGVAEYYKYAVDRHRLYKLKYTMEQALVKTLAWKFKCTARQIYRKYHGTQVVNGQTYKTLQVEVPTRQGVRVIYWGAIPLKYVKKGLEPINDIQQFAYHYINSDLVQRLQADSCELCGFQGHCEVHHVRKLSDLKKRWAGRKAKPAWVIRMIAIQRKTLVVCQPCHRAIHAGHPTPKSRI